jgi:hypothetical protein
MIRNIRIRNGKNGYDKKCIDHKESRPRIMINNKKKVKEKANRENNMSGETGKSY